MQEDHPHRFFKPFNGIDAIGRFSIIVAFSFSVYFFEIVFIRPYPLMGFNIIGYGYILTGFNIIGYGYIGLGMLVFFSCGLGLCLRKNIAWKGAIILYPVYSILSFCLIMIVFLGAFYATGSSGSMGDEELTFMLSWNIGGLVVICSIVYYLLNPDVKAEFTGVSAGQVSSRPNLPFLLGFTSASLANVIGGYAMLDVYIRDIEYWMLRKYDPSVILPNINMPFFFLICGLSVCFPLIIGLWLKVKFSRLALKVTVILFSSLVVLAFYFPGMYAFRYNAFSLARISFIALAFFYPGWSVFRYLGSKQGIEAFGK